MLWAVFLCFLRLSDLLNSTPQPASEHTSFDRRRCMVRSWRLRFEDRCWGAPVKVAPHSEQTTVLEVVVGEGVQGDMTLSGFDAKEPRLGVHGEMGDGAMAKLLVSGDVEGVVQVPLLWRLELLMYAETGLSKLSECRGLVKEPVGAEVGLLVGDEDGTRDGFFWPLFARAVLIGGGRLPAGFSDLLFSFSCSVDIASI